MNRFRTIVGAVLKSLGLLPAVRGLRRLITPPPPPRREQYQRFLQYKHQFGNVLKYDLTSADREKRKKVLVCGAGYPAVEPELGLIKALEAAGCTPVVIAHHGDLLDRKYYHLATKHVVLWEDFTGRRNTAAAAAIIDQCRSVAELTAFKYRDARVGLYAIATTLRRLRLGALDCHSAAQRGVLTDRLDLSMCYARAAQSIVREIGPHVALFVDGVYTPEGEFVDECLANGVHAVSWDAAHKSDTLMLKRYKPRNRDDDRMSLSTESWQVVRDMPWTDRNRERLDREIRDSYATGDWFSSAGTQFNKRLFDAGAVNGQLGLNSTKKTAFIFPHIFWDASMGRGEDLFRDYEEWFVESVRAACRNNHLNWVIKIHPAHVGKAVQDGFRGEPAENITLREHIGELPPHVFFVPTDSPISTFSLFAVMDYCLTVRGTVGIEAARLGIPVLTAGTGRYDRKGFTIDSDTREQYLEKVAHIQDIPRLSATQQELAERYAYGIFLLRPLAMTTIGLQYHNPSTYLGNFKINISKKEDWYNALDLREFSHWAVDSDDPDYLAARGMA